MGKFVLSLTHLHWGQFLARNKQGLSITPSAPQKATRAEQAAGWALALGQQRFTDQTDYILWNTLSCLSGKSIEHRRLIIQAS